MIKPFSEKLIYVICAVSIIVVASRNFLLKLLGEPLATYGYSSSTLVYSIKKLFIIAMPLVVILVLTILFFIILHKIIRYSDYMPRGNKLSKISMYCFWGILILFCYQTVVVKIYSNVLMSTPEAFRGESFYFTRNYHLYIHPLIQILYFLIFLYMVFCLYKIINKSWLLLFVGLVLFSPIKEIIKSKVYYYYIRPSQEYLDVFHIWVEICIPLMLAIILGNNFLRKVKADMKEKQLTAHLEIPKEGVE